MEVMRDLARRLEAAGHGARTSLITEAATHYGVSQQTLYRKLSEVGWTSGRKARADKGTTSMSESALVAIAGMQKVAVRDNGKETLHTPLAVSLADTSGIEVPVSAPQVNRLLRARRLDVKSQQAERPVTELRAPYPNHTHEVDPSLCLIYYMKGHQYLMEERKFYKNKLENFARIKLKVWRYTGYEKASGSIGVRYYEAAGENQRNLFEFLAWMWSKKPEISWWGVPKVLLWDKGSANSAGAIQNFLNALEVQAITHEAGNARAKGGVENANNLVETQFESRLRFQPVDSVEDLNAAATLWQEAYNANSLPRLDTRIRREGIAPVARYALWQKIRADQLRELPDIELCRSYLLGKEDSRKVSRNMAITFRHPQADATRTYDVDSLPGVVAGCWVTVRPLVFGNLAIQITVPRYDGEPLHYRLEPQREYDEFGQLATAPIIGERYAAKAHTDIERAARAIDEATWGTANREEAKKAKDRGDTPFATTTPINSLSHLADIPRTAWMPRTGTAIEMVHQLVEEQPLTVVEACKSLVSRGVPSDGLYPRIAGRYPDGVPEADLDALAAELLGTNATPLRAVAGG
ncbi:MAG: integrase [Proteobacteria bacterium]|nr:integrase [Pseudomonadota bacterium]